MSFPLRMGQIGAQGCPIDPTAPIAPPWDAASVLSGQSPQGQAAAAQSHGPMPVTEAGGLLAKYGKYPVFKVYEQLFRIEPNESWFDPARDPTRPTQFEIATVRADAGQVILLFDYSIRPYRFSGINSFDFVPMDEGRLSGSMGYVVQKNGQNPGNLEYRLDPLSSTLRRQALQFNRSLKRSIAQMTADDYAITASQSYASAAGYGTSLMPQSPRRFGAHNAPFLETIYEDEVFTFSGVVYRQIESPVAFVECRISGYKTSSNIAKRLLRDLDETLR